MLNELQVHEFQTLNTDLRSLHYYEHRTAIKIIIEKNTVHIPARSAGNEY